MRFTHTLFLSLCLLLISGCDAIDDFSKMNEKQSRIQALIKEKHGWNAQVGWNIHNAELSQVTLVLSAEEVANERVATLQAIAREAVSQTFTSTPKAIYVTLVTDPIEE